MKRIKDHLLLSVRDLQQQAAGWRDKNFPGWTGEDQFMGAVEEMGELAHAMLKRKQGIRGDAAQHTADIQDACADVIIFLTGVATAEGFDLATVLTETWEKVHARDWVNAPLDGQLTIDG